jgi:hypothetical protein
MKLLHDIAQMILDCVIGDVQGDGYLLTVACPQRTSLLDLHIQIKQKGPLKTRANSKLIITLEIQVIKEPFDGVKKLNRPTRMLAANQIFSS